MTSVPSTSGSAPAPPAAAAPGPGSGAARQPPTGGVLWLTDAADVRCTHHLGKAPQRAGQDWLRIEGRPVLVDPDPVGRTIGGCPNIGATIKPCTSTEPLEHGASAFVRIAGRPVVRADLWGFTDGTPPHLVRYTVIDPAQQVVREQAG